MRFCQQDARMVDDLPSEIANDVDNKIVVTQNLGDLLMTQRPEKPGIL